MNIFQDGVTVIIYIRETSTTLAQNNYSHSLRFGNDQEGIQAHVYYHFDIENFTEDKKMNYYKGVIVLLTALVRREMRSGLITMSALCSEERRNT